MRNIYRMGLAVALIGLSAAVYSTAQEKPSEVPPTEQTPDNAVKVPGGMPSEPTVTFFDHHEVQGILGKEVRSTANENMGRIVDVVVDRSGQVRAAIIDFGGFLGVGSRKIAVAWNALRFPPNEDHVDRIVLELTRDQVRAAPEYKPDKTVVVLGASGSLESLP
jgi:PRC-barrel domain